MTILQWSPLYLVGIYVCIFFISNVSGIPQSPVATAKSSQEAFEFVAKAESELHKAGKKATQIEWAYATNITDENEKKKLENTVSNYHFPFSSYFQYVSISLYFAFGQSKLINKVSEYVNIFNASCYNYFSNFSCMAINSSYSIKISIYLI